MKMLMMMMLAMVQWLVTRFGMPIMMIALLQKHVALSEQHMSTSYLGEQENLSPFPLTTGRIVLPNGNSTSLNLINQNDKESLSLSKSKYGSDEVHEEKASGGTISSYRTTLTMSHVDWDVGLGTTKLFGNLSSNSDDAHDANDRRDDDDDGDNASGKDLHGPFQGELTLVISTSGQSQSQPFNESYDSVKSGADDYTLFDNHVNDPNFEPTLKNTFLVVPLWQNTQFEHLSVLCDTKMRGTTEANGNDVNSGKDKKNSSVPHGVTGDGGGSRSSSEALASDMNHKIKGRFRLTFYLLDFSWSDDGMSGPYKTDQVEAFEEDHDGIVWIPSCPKNIICMEKQKQKQGLPSSSSSNSTTATPINTDYEEETPHSERSTIEMSDDFVTKAPAPTQSQAAAPAKQLVKVSKTQPFIPAYECHQVQKSKFRNDESNATTTVLLFLDIFPAIKAWLNKHSDCPSEFSRSFVFSLKIEEIAGDDVDVPPHSHNVLSSIPAAIESSALLHSAGKGHAVLNMEYTIDARCAVPTAEACPVGKCSSADVIYKFRSDCSPSNTGHFLILAWENATKNSAQYTLTSPWFRESHSEACHLEAYIHMHNMQTVMKVVIESNISTFVPLPKLGNGLNTWERHKQMIGRVKEPFRIVLEVDNNEKVPSHFAIDDIRLVDCFPSNKTCKTSCSDREFQCSEGRCIDRNRLCDLNKDCLYGEDEEQDCAKILPHWNGSCTFESDWCGWHPLSNPASNITWERTNKPSSKSDTGAKTDHTYNNSTGFYLLVDMKVRFADFHRTVLKSPVFAHPPAYNQNSSSPYYQSCQLRFFYHMFGSHIGSLDVELVPKNPRNPWAKPYRFCERVGNQGNIWRRASCKIPSFKGSKKYYLQLTAIRGVRGALGDIAIDDISLSPECFGIGVPLKEKGDYDYETILNSPNEYLGNLSTAYQFSTCNSTGRTGPSQEQCDSAYNGTLLESEIKIDSIRNGVQIWTVPESKSYTLIAKGASGGRGALLNQMTSHGSIVKTTMFLRKGEKIYILVGQEGISGCEQSPMGKRGDAVLDRPCTNQSDPSPPPRHLRIFQRRRSRRSPPALQKLDPLGELSRLNRISRGGGGGGGATIVYKMNGKLVIPILIAAGGGGLGYNASASILPHGRGLNVSLHADSGYTQAWGAGGGGGWEGATPNVKTSSLSIAFDDIRRSITVKERERDNATMLISAGLSLVDGGGLGGFPCEQSDPWGAAGGFGGGGGGCIAGGGGGGYVGGNAYNSLSANGEGGWSYIGKGGMYPSVEPGGHSGPGEFLAIPSFAGCDCEHACVLIDDFDMHTGCVCPENSILREDGISCVGRESFHAVYMVVLIVTAAVVFCLIGILCFCLYNRYQRQKMNMMRRKKMGGTDLQLSRLRAQSGAGGVLTEYNPNYEFGGETYTLTDLKEIPRENLRLVKALGQGAFGEVYQGFYRHRDGDAVEMPVAVKTLPALSSNQAEMDFLMEALIMSKFNHPNIVHFIGVCFDKHPRFIILELLAGGDLKSFLRESRPKPDKGSPLTMRDLLLCAMDVAKGCKYLEDNHFIHRDIAARNCLLTTKGPGRVVKIADFGMARDIYRADYYKKGGKAMLPVKWMPPEAFLDGIFTSKTDVWSYGVLLWEIFSLGYMPYPGRGNQDVMQLITNGGRLEPPSNCPPPVYGIMTQCWHPIPEERPNFSTLLERVGYCLQDPEVVNAPLPVFQRPPSSERDTTLMRPPNPDSGSCLRIQSGNRYSISTTPDLTSPNSSTADYLVPLTHYSFSNPASPPPRPDSQPTSPTTPQIPESESTETMLDEEEPLAEDEEKESSPDSSKENTKYADITVKTGGGGGSSNNSSNSNNTNSSKPNVNGIDTGVTLSAAGLEKLDRASSGGAASKRPSQYANVGVSKPRLPSPVNLTVGGGGSGGGAGGATTPGGDPSDEEIRC